MPLPSLKLLLLNYSLAGNAHFELALADVPADGKTGERMILLGAEAYRIVINSYADT